MRGPVVYCLEEVDNGKGLQCVYLPEEPDFKEQYEPDLLSGVVTLTSKGRRLDQSGWDADTLYRPAERPEFQDAELKWVPYYAWANRGIGEMTVWVDVYKRQGYDLELTRAVSERVKIPVIASGGAGTMEHFYDAFVQGKACLLYTSRCV